MFSEQRMRPSREKQERQMERPDIIACVSSDIPEARFTLSFPGIWINNSSFLLIIELIINFLSLS